MKIAPLKVWLADLTYTQQTVSADVIPNAIGGIAEYAEQQLDFLAPIRLFKYPEALAEAFEKEGFPRIMGFSCYVWNANLAHAFAAVVKKHAPETVVVFGGPNFPIDPEDQMKFMAQRTAIDIFVEREGEETFANLIQALHNHDFDLAAVRELALPSVFSRLPDGTPVLARETMERIRDLGRIPSPYISGRLDPFFDGKLQPIIQTNRGCPFSCTFCAEGNKFFTKVRRAPMEKIRAEIDYIGGKMARLRKEEGRNDLFIADSNFGMYRQDLDVCRALAQSRRDHQWPEYINVATGKNQKERILEAVRLIDGALRLSGSVQSLDPQVMENIKRSNISTEALMDLGKSIGESGANSYCEIILALPGDSKASHYRTIESVMEAGFNQIILYQLMLLPGSEMGTRVSRRKFGMDTRYRALPRCYGHYNILGEETAVAEVEEVCVGNAQLDFDDYLECRKFHLIISIFYNDGVFSTLLKLLKMLGLPPFRWLELLRDAPLKSRLGEIFESFLEATRNELWDAREALEDYFQTEGVVERFIRGELGYNLIYVHTTRVITGPVGELAEMARVALGRYLREAGKETPETIAFIEDALTYHTLRLKDVFTDPESEFFASLAYDVQAFEEHPDPRAIADFKLPAPRAFRWFLDDGQKEVIRRNLAVYGHTPIGIGRILTYVYVRKLLRNMTPAVPGEQAGTAPPQVRASGRPGLTSP